jgi:SNF2 family DNA or RNA helicase
VSIKELKVVAIKFQEKIKESSSASDVDDGHDLFGEQAIGYSEPLAEQDFFVKSKLEVLFREINNLPSDDKVIVFTQFEAARANIEHMMQQRHVRFISIKGNMTPKRRGSLLAQFSLDPTIKVILLSMRGMSRGLNITAANHAFFFEPCLDASMVFQAIHRIERIGQSKATQIHHMLMDDSIEGLLYANIRNDFIKGASKMKQTESTSNTVASRLEMLLHHLACQTTALE